MDDVREYSGDPEAKFYDPTKPVAFLHVPKSGGNSLSEAISVALKPRAAFGAFDRCMFGDFDDFESMSEASRGSIMFDSRDLPHGLDFLAGHMSFSAMSRAYPLAQFITVVREPMSRLISLWLFWRSLPAQFLEPWGRWADLLRKSHLPLGDFLRAPDVACQTDNQFTRLLLWPHRLVPGSDFIDERHDEALAEEAESRLKEFCFVDLLENPEFAANLQTWLQRPLLLHRLNETPNVPEPLKTSMAGELDSETLTLIEARTRLDLKLWTRAVTQRRPEIDSHVWRDQIITANVARFSRLNQGGLDR